MFLSLQQWLHRHISSCLEIVSYSGSSDHFRKAPESLWKIQKKNVCDPAVAISATHVTQWAAIRIGVQVPLYLWWSATGGVPCALLAAFLCELQRDTVTKVRVRGGSRILLTGGGGSATSVVCAPPAGCVCVCVCMCVCVKGGVRPPRKFENYISNSAIWRHLGIKSPCNSRFKITVSVPFQIKC